MKISVYTTKAMLRLIGLKTNLDRIQADLERIVSILEAEKLPRVAGLEPFDNIFMLEYGILIQPPIDPLIGYCYLLIPKEAIDFSVYFGHLFYELPSRELVEFNIDITECKTP